MASTIDNRGQLGATIRRRGHPTKRLPGPRILIEFALVTSSGVDFQVETRIDQNLSRYIHVAQKRGFPRIICLAY
jgi:hypothetical protein